MYELKFINTPELPLLRCIADGTKKAEGRIATDYVRSFKVGEKLLLKATEEYAICKILSLHFYDSFENMLESEGFKNLIPLAEDADKALEVYNSFPGSQRVKSMGCCAIGVQYLEGKILK